MQPLRYIAAVETIPDDEQETIDGIIKGMTQQTQTVEKREHHAVRASHAKTIRLPRQYALSPARQKYFEEVMTYKPAHSLTAHRPLGSAMRARLQVYGALSDFRQRENGVQGREPARIEDIPA